MIMRRDSRILLITAFAPPIGGATAKARRLLDGLRDAGFTVDVINTSPGRYKKNRERIPFHTRLVGLKSLARAVAMIPRSRYVLVAGSNRQLTVFLPSLLSIARRFRVPLAMHCYGGAADCYLASLDDGPRRRTLAALNGLDLFLPETRQLLETLTAAHPDVRQLQLPNLIEPTAARATPWTSRTLVYVGQIREPKGVYHLIDAFVTCDGGGELCFAGPLLPGEEARWAAAIERHPRIRWLGPLEATDVRRELTKARALVLPTLDPGEGHPAVVLEAFSVGLPVLASDLRGIPELVAPEKNGWLTKTGDKNDLVRMLSDVLDMDETRLRQLHAGALRRAERFTPKNVLSELIDHIRMAIRDPGASEFG